MKQARKLRAKHHQNKQASLLGGLFVLVILMTLKKPLVRNRSFSRIYSAKAEIGQALPKAMSRPIPPGF